MEMAQRPWALAVADANWFTTEHLFRAVPPERAATLLLHCLDFRNAYNQGRRPFKDWALPTFSVGPSVWRRNLALPSGWMKRFPRLGMMPISHTIRAWQRRHARENPLALVMTYPFYLELHRRLKPSRSIYYNVDDYTLYWPSSAAVVRSLELETVRRSDLTVCVAKVRADELRQALPQCAGKIHHMPHGAPSWTIADRALHRPDALPDDIRHLPRPILGYVGSLEDRVDWVLLERVAKAIPEASVVLVGRIDPVDRPDRWQCLSLPNVHAIGWRPQTAISAYNRAFDVCLIPYLASHPFNIACCPTKIMDTMGTGRPMVSTDVPECRLSDHLFDVESTNEGFIHAIQGILDRGSDDGRSELRWSWAKANTCEQVVIRLLDAIPAGG